MRLSVPEQSEPVTGARRTLFRYVRKRNIEVASAPYSLDKKALLATYDRQGKTEQRDRR